MQTRQVKNAADARQIVLERDLSHVQVGVFDIDGILRGKYLSKDKFLVALDQGFGLCDVLLGWDSQDQFYDNVAYTGWHTGYPDAPLRILPDSCRELPFADNSLFFLCEFLPPAETICPRSTLRRVLNTAHDMGLEAYAGFEYEFFMFEETAHSIRAKRYRHLKPLAPGQFGYSVLRTNVHHEFYRQLLEIGTTMDFPLESLHEETGPGVIEAAIAVDSAVAAADKAALFKTFAKVLTQRHGRMATFMARWSPEWPGSSGHIHLSLLDRDGQRVFHDPAKPHNVSDTLRHFVAGQQRLMPELLAMIAPTVNSYARLMPGLRAPTQANWGIQNRSCALRVIPGNAQTQRVEYRVAAADANPYIILAAALASGLWGIENKAEPLPPVQGNAYQQALPAQFELPKTLWEAAQRLKGSQMARDWFGDAFVDHFVATREWEEREFRKHITDWEMERYFEII